MDNSNEGVLKAVPDKGGGRGVGGVLQSTVIFFPQPDKIVQDLIDCILHLKEHFSTYKCPINDDCLELHKMCAKLEQILRHGMKDRHSLTGRKKDYWDYFFYCLAHSKGANDGIKYVKSHAEQKTSQGKGRAFIRFALVHQRLADCLQQCSLHPKTADWYKSSSVWLRSKESSVVISSLYDLNDLHFDLLPRGYDLDNAWPSFSVQQVAGTNRPFSRWSSITSMDTLSVSSSDPFVANHLQQEMSSAKLSHSTDVTSRSLVQCQERERLEHCLLATRGELASVREELGAKSERLLASLTNNKSLLKENIVKEEMIREQVSELDNLRTVLVIDNTTDQTGTYTDFENEDFRSSEKGGLSSLKLIDVSCSTDGTISPVAGFPDGMVVCAGVESNAEKILSSEQELLCLRQQNRELSKDLERATMLHKQAVVDLLESLKTEEDLLCRLKDAESAKCDVQGWILDQRRLKDVMEHDAETETLRESVQESSSSLAAVSLPPNFMDNPSNTNDSRRMGDTISSDVTVSASKMVISETRITGEVLNDYNCIVYPPLIALSEHSELSSPANGLVDRLVSCAVGKSDEDGGLNFFPPDTPQSAMVGKKEDLAESMVKLETENRTLLEEMTKLEDEMAAKDCFHSSQVESFQHEISALRFQLSVEQLQHEDTVRNMVEAAPSSPTMRSRHLLEKDAAIAKLDAELATVRFLCETKRTGCNQETVKRGSRARGTIGDGCDHLADEAKYAEAYPQHDRMAVGFDEITRLQSDNKQLKRKLIKILKDKDSLWRQADELSYEYRRRSEGRRSQGADQSRCMSCSCQFSLFTWKHHCRLCGGAFCYGCSDNWFQTAYSGQTLRTCSQCYSHQQSLDEDAFLLGTLSDAADCCDSDRESVTVDDDSVYVTMVEDAASPAVCCSTDPPVPSANGVRFRVSPGTDASKGSPRLTTGGFREPVSASTPLK